MAKPLYILLSALISMTCLFYSTPSPAQKTRQENMSDLIEGLDDEALLGDPIED